MRHLKSISEFHRWRGLPAPQHPLISVLDVATFGDLDDAEPSTWLLEFYVIAIKRVENFLVNYGQQQYRSDKGIMYFMAPNQLFNIYQTNGKVKKSGWLLLVHPDFLWATPLAKSIKTYDFWRYTVNEALFLSEQEETTLKTIVENIRKEYSAGMDRFSKSIIVTHIESLLNYAERFYDRQFLTRRNVHYQIIDDLTKLLSDYFNNEDLMKKGLPSVQFVADQLNFSPKYLTSLLRSLTEKNTQQHIHEKLIDKAKEMLSTSEMTISEISYALGFEHVQSFSKLFRSKAQISPLAFRRSFVN